MLRVHQALQTLPESQLSQVTSQFQGMLTIDWDQRVEDNTVDNNNPFFILPMLSHLLNYETGSYRRNLLSDENNTYSSLLYI